MTQLIRSAHVDTFCRDHLPPAEQWPEFRFDIPEVRYPERLNCAVELLDRTAQRYGAERECLRPPAERASERSDAVHGRAAEAEAAGVGASVSSAGEEPDGNAAQTTQSDGDEQASTEASKES